MKSSETISNAHCTVLSRSAVSRRLWSHSTPLFQCQRRVIRIHAEAVNHLTRYRLYFFLMSTFPHRCSCLCAEPVHQLLIFRFMNMSVQHISQRCSICPTPELAVIAENRIVHQHDLALVVMDFRVILDPYKPGSIKILVLQAPVIVIPANQIELSF